MVIYMQNAALTDISEQAVNSGLNRSKAL